MRVKGLFTAGGCPNSGVNKDGMFIGDMARFDLFRETDITKKEIG
jgi:hypothetical protein